LTTFLDVGENFLISWVTGPMGSNGSIQAPESRIEAVQCAWVMEACDELAWCGCGEWNGVCTVRISEFAAFRQFDSMVAEQSESVAMEIAKQSEVQ